MPVYWPNGSLTIPRVSSEFNPARKNPVTGIVQPHNGIDLIGFVDCCAPVDGRVIFAGYNGGAGNEVRIAGDNGHFYRLLHHERLYVATNARVAARQPVGRMGTTGQSTGVHSHFETHENRLWNYVNPRDHMARMNAGIPAGSDGEEFEMPLNADTDYAAFATMLQRALRYDVRPNGIGADWKLGPTVWERLNGIESVAGQARDAAKAVKVELPADMADQIADKIAGALEGRVVTRDDLKAALRSITLEVP